MLFFCLRSHLFTNWIIVVSLLGAALSTASFFAAEYRLFTLSSAEAYFPNPVTALCAFAGFVSFLLFLSSVTLKKRFKEANISVFSRESFIGLAVAALLTAGISIGFLALLPALFMFLPDMPLRLLPALFRTTLRWTGLTAVLFFFIAFQRRSVNPGWAGISRKNILIFWGFFLILIYLCLRSIPNGGQIVLYSLPAALILSTTVSAVPFKLPVTFGEIIDRLKSLSSLKYGAFFCALGFLIFSASFSCAFLNRSETVTSIRLQKDDQSSFPCFAEQLAEKAGTAAAQYRLVCRPPLLLLTGNLTFQWQENELKARFLQTDRFSTRLIQADQTQEDALTLRTLTYPALQLAGSGLFLICLGTVFLLFSVKKEQRS